MFARLWWKEFRVFGPVCLILILASAGLDGFLLSVNSYDVRSGALTLVNLLWAVLYAFAASSAAFAGERESHTLDFLDALPVRRRTLWLGKLTFVMGSTLALAILLAALAALGPRGVPRSVRIATSRSSRSSGSFCLRLWRGASNSTRPQIAPIRSEGIKTPLDTDIPYVHVANR